MSTIGYYICVPFAWLVRLFYNLTNSYGVALILFTLVIKLIMLPFQMKSKKSMMRMSRVSGQMQDLQKRYAKNQAKLQEEMQKFYEEEGVNPMSGCLWSFLPLPILMALYSIIRQPITHFMMLSKDVLQTVVQSVADAGVDLTNIVMMDKATGAPALKDGLYQMAAYGQINLVKAVQEMGLSTPDGWFNVNYNFLGLDLTATPWEYVKNFTFTWAVIGVILIPILAGLSQFVFSKLTMKTQPQADAAGGASMKSMMYMMPLMSVYIAFIMPAALGVYWIAQSVFSLIQEAILNKTFSAKLSEEVNDERAQEIRKFLSGLLQQMEVQAEVKVYLPEKGRYKVFLEGQGLGAIIGRRGETLDAIQQLTSYSVNRTGSRVRVQLDAENYRAKREQSLERLANKVAGKVVKYRRSVTLEPMNAYERHVIHTALQEVPGVTTYSTGVDPNRRVIVAYDREKK